MQKTFEYILTCDLYKCACVYLFITLYYEEGFLGDCGLSPML